MECVAACLGGKRMLRQRAALRIARVDELRDHLEVAAGLLLGPGVRAGSELLEVEVVVGIRVADDAASVAVLLFEKDRLDAALVETVVESRFGLRLGNRRQRH